MKILANTSEEVEDKLTAKTAEEILGLLKNGEVKCLDVLRFFQMKASGITGKLNCVTEFILEAEVSSRLAVLRKIDY